MDAPVQRTLRCCRGEVAESARRVAAAVESDATEPEYRIGDALEAVCECSTLVCVGAIAVKVFIQRQCHNAHVCSLTTQARLRLRP